MKNGGPNPLSNLALASVIEKAKDLDVPKEILERNIKRASEKGQEAYIEKVYEVSMLINHIQQSDWHHVSVFAIKVIILLIYGDKCENN